MILFGTPCILCMREHMHDDGIQLPREGIVVE